MLLRSTFSPAQVKGSHNLKLSSRCLEAYGRAAPFPTTPVGVPSGPSALNLHLIIRTLPLETVPQLSQVLLRAPVYPQNSYSPGWSLEPCLSTVSSAVREFAIVPLHAAPADAVTEIDALYDVYLDIRKKWDLEVSPS